MNTDTRHPATARKGLHVSLWAVQALLALFYVYAGVTKLATPAAELAKMMPWTGVYPGLVPFTGVVDLLGGVGMVLPMLTGVRPRLTVWAARGQIVLQLLATGFHLSRGEFMVVPMNLCLLALAAFVLWGRARALPLGQGRSTSGQVA